jgi:ABC-type sugar transport system ATPase subunit
VGPNGAGKTSFIKILSGIYSYDSGEIYLNEEPFCPNSPIDAQKNGIYTIHQELQVVDCMSIMDNIFLGYKKDPLDVFVNWRQMKKKTAALLKLFNLNCSPNTLVSSLNISEKYIVSICKAFLRKVEILILDEPTAGLTAIEQNIVFDLIKKIKEQGSSIIYITHRMDEVMDLCDSVTILRDGKSIFESKIKNISKEKIISIMAGRTIDKMDTFFENEPAKKELLLETRSICKKNIYNSISLQLHAGEILGIVGAIGSGRSAILKTIFGEMKQDSGEIYINNTRLDIAHPVNAIKHKIGYLTDDRLLLGIIPDLSIKENIMIAHNNISQVIVHPQEQIDYSLDSIINLDVKLASLDQPIKYLSGGNQQKVLLSRWMAANSNILLLDEPTKGVDISSRNDIYLWIKDKAQEDCGFILNSSEIPEVLMLCTNIIVLNKGIITDRMSGEEATEERIIKAMHGNTPYAGIPPVSKARSMSSI